MWLLQPICHLPTFMLPAAIPSLAAGNGVTQRCLPPLLSHSLGGVCSQSSLLSRRNLSAIQDREICCYSISCKEKDNIGAYQWLWCGAWGAAVGVRLVHPGREGVTARGRGCKCPLAFADITLQWLIQHSKSRRS